MMKVLPENTRLRIICTAIARMKRATGNWPTTYKEVLPETGYADTSGVGDQVRMAVERGYIVDRGFKCHGPIQLSAKGLKKFAPDLEETLAASPTPTIPAAPPPAPSADRPTLDLSFASDMDIMFEVNRRGYRMVR
jgi:hypothetical protein